MDDASPSGTGSEIQSTREDAPLGEAAELKISLFLDRSVSVPHRPIDLALLGPRTLHRLPTFTCMAYARSTVIGKSGMYLFAGRANGEIVGWPLETGSPKKTPSTQRGVPQCNLEHLVLGSHRGGVTCLAVIDTPPPNCHRLLVSGSYDADVKVWEPFGQPFQYPYQYGPQTGERAVHMRCTQTISAHDGTVSTIASHLHLLITGSVDKTIKVWKFEAGREHLCFPRFSLCQIFVFDNWVTSIWAREVKVAESTQGEIFVADSSGNISTFRSTVDRVEKEGDSSLPTPGAELVTIATSIELLRYSRLQELRDALKPTILAPSADYGSVTRRSTVEAAKANATGDAKIGGSMSVDKHRQGFTKILPLPDVNHLVSLSYENVARISDLVDFRSLTEIPHPDVKRRFIDVAWNEQYEELVLLDDAGMLFIYEHKASRLRCSMFIGKYASCVLAIPMGEVVKLERSSSVASTLADRRRSTALNKTFSRPEIWVAHCERIDRIRVERYKTFVEHPGHTGRIVELLVNVSSVFYGPNFENPGMQSKVTEESAQFFLASAAVDNTIRLWSPSMVCLTTLAEHGSEISCMCVMHGTSWVITGHDSGYLKFWSLSNGRNFRFVAHENTITFVGEGLHRGVKGRIDPWRHLFTVSFDGCLAIWEIPIEGSKAKCEGRLRVSHCELLCAAYDTINAAYIVGDSVGRISIWSVDDLKPVRMFSRSIVPSELEDKKASPQIRPAHAEAVTWLALDGNLLMSGGEDEQLYIWNTANGDCVKELSVGGNGPFASRHETPGEVQHFLVLPENGDILTCTRKGYLIVYSQSTGDAVSYYKIDEEVSRVAYNRFSGDVLAGRQDGLIIKIPIALFKQLVQPPETEAHESDAAGDEESRLDPSPLVEAEFQSFSGRDESPAAVVKRKVSRKPLVVLVDPDSPVFNSTGASAAAGS